MVSEASKKKAAQKKAAAAAKRGGKAAATSSKTAAATAAASDSQNEGVDKLSNGAGVLQISDRTCTGVLCSHPLSRDIRVSFSIFLYFVFK
jgi:ATP-binding cassette subfamily F protein 2